jgi:protein-tyrosine kinase
MNVTPPQTVLLRQATGNRSIGAILVDARRLSLQDAERILALQQTEGLRFGDAGLKLGVITPEDISFALARQYGYPYLLVGESNVADEITAAYEPFSPQVETLRALRSQLMLRRFTGQRENRTLAITSPGRVEGRSWLAANLAVVFSQLGEHTLLIDADLRNPRQHSLFGIKNRTGLSSILSNRGEVSTIQRVTSLVDLSVLPAGPIPPNPQELLGRPQFAKFLDELAGEFGVIIIDTPAATEYADAQTIASRASATLLLARKHRTSIGTLGSLADNLRQTGVEVIGSVVLEF